MAVSSGAKDSEYFRSGLGARFAAEAARESMVMFASAFESAISRESLFIDERTQARIIRQLESSIIVGWRKKVQEHLECHPFQAEEINAVEDQAHKKGYQNGMRMEYAYRANVLAALVAEGYCLVIRNGDGECTMIDRNHKVSEPVPWNESCKENFSTYMCQRTAIWEFRHFCSKTVPEALFLMTNDVYRCFKQEKDYHVYIRQLFQEMQKSPDSAEKYLNGQLSKGSHSNICLAVGISAKTVKAETERKGEIAPKTEQTREGGENLKSGQKEEGSKASAADQARVGQELIKPKQIVGRRDLFEIKRERGGLPWRMILTAAVMVGIFWVVREGGGSTEETTEIQPTEQESPQEVQGEAESEVVEPEEEKTAESTRESLREEMMTEDSGGEVPETKTELPEAKEKPSQTKVKTPETMAESPQTTASPPQTTAAPPPQTTAPLPQTTAAPPPQTTTAPQPETPPLPPPIEAAPETQPAEPTVDAGQAELDAALQMWKVQ